MLFIYKSILFESGNEKSLYPTEQVPLLGSKCKAIEKRKIVSVREPRHLQEACRHPGIVGKAKRDRDLEERLIGSTREADCRARTACLLVPCSHSLDSFHSLLIDLPAACPWLIYKHVKSPSPLHPLDGILYPRIQIFVSIICCHNIKFNLQTLSNFLSVYFFIIFDLI